MASNRASYGCLAILALVLLRLVVGAHFFAEGRQKFVYDYASGRYRINPSFASQTKGFLSQAKGPVADIVQGIVASEHDWQMQLAVPQQQLPLTEEESAKRIDWTADYDQRRADARRAKEPMPIEIPEFAPYRDWATQVIADWKSVLKDITAIDSLSEAQRKSAASAFELRHQQLADYLAGESDSIAEYRHELWRLAQMKSTEMTDEVPFHDQRIREKQAELARTPLKWVNQVAEFDENYYVDLNSVLTEEQKSDAHTATEFDAAVADPAASSVARISSVVAYVTVGVGICLLLGFFTRLASLVGIAFLISVIASQPPWITGAETGYFYYQVVECFALLVLLVFGAGRWLGIDYFTYALWSWIWGARSED